MKLGLFIYWLYILACRFITHPQVLDGFNSESKDENNEGEGVGVHSLTCSTLGVEARAGAPGWD
jgi:hypothetical protein